MKTFLINIWQFWKKVTIIIKKINGELKNYIKISKSWKKIEHKESFQFFCMPLILFDTVYRKDGNYYDKVF